MGDFPSWRPSRKRDYQFRKKYSISLDEWNDILASQGGACAICQTTDFGKKGPVVDHCHEFGTVRGILCTPCNMGIGAFRDRPGILRAALKYLDKEHLKTKKA